MKILFTNNNLKIGGIETFMVRLAKNRIKEDFDIIFLLFSKKVDNELLRELKKYSKVYFLDDYLFMPKFLGSLPTIVKLLFPINKSKLNKDFLNTISHIHAVNINSLLFSNRVLGANQKISISIGTYHINEYKLKNYRANFFGRKLYNYVKSFSEKNFLFFNEICRDEYAKNYKNEIKESLVAPIGVDLKQFNNTKCGLQNNRIVSIGRLTEWKTYNYHIIEAIKELNDKKNLIFKYDSYGDGVERKKLEQKVLDYGLEDYIKFHPSIPYSKFKETIANSLLFLGSGTALIEASACGLPALIGIENQSKDEPLTFGFLHNLNTLSYQEIQLNFIKSKISEQILKVNTMSSDQYQIECLSAIQRAKDFDISKSVKVFNDLITKSLVNKSHLNYRIIFLIVFSQLLHLSTNFHKSNFFKRF